MQGGWAASPGHATNPGLTVGGFSADHSTTTAVGPWIDPRPPLSSPQVLIPHPSSLATSPRTSNDPFLTFYGDGILNHWPPGMEEGQQGKQRVGPPL